MKIEYCGISDKGRRREINQDAVLMKAHKDKALFVVADGMGGHSHGEVASAVIVEEMEKWWEDFTRNEQKEDFREAFSSLRQRLELINRIIYERYNGPQVCGSTLAALFFYGVNYGIFSSGDSRIYCRNGHKLKQLTTDDVWENQPQAGLYPEKERKEHPDYGKLICAIGVSPDAAIKGMTDTLKDNDCFLLCSDGLYKMCSEEDMKRTLKDYRNNKDGKQLLAQLLKKVYENGAVDNVSIILVRV